MATLPQSSVGALYAENRRSQSAIGDCLLWVGVADPLAHSARACIVNYMVQFSHQQVDASFAALADPTRRGVLERLWRRDQSISELADAFEMTLTGMKKHVSVLEHAGLVTTQKVGRVRTCRLGASGLEAEAAWIESYRQMWAARFAALDVVIAELKQEETADERK